MKKITLSGEWHAVHSAIAKLMLDGWHIRRFDHIQGAEVKIELYLDDPKTDSKKDA